MRTDHAQAHPLAAAALFVAPAAASAATYKVRDSSGRTVGTVQPQGPVGATVRSTSGKQVGLVSTQDGYWLVNLPNADLITLTRLSSKAWGVNVWGSHGGHYDGRARHAGGRWVLQKKVNGTWVRRGNVPGACKGQFAAGALRLLLWGKVRVPSWRDFPSSYTGDDFFAGLEAAKAAIEAGFEDAGLVADVQYIKGVNGATSYQRPKAGARVREWTTVHIRIAVVD